MTSQREKLATAYLLEKDDGRLERPVEMEVAKIAYRVTR